MRLISLTFLLYWTLGGLAQQAVPIANNVGRTSWTEDQIKAVFLGERSSWPNGLAVVVVLPSSSSDSFEQVAAWAFDSDGFEYQKFWLSLVFQGRANPPVFVDTEQAVLDYVEDHPGAIGLLHDVDFPHEMRLHIQ